jgi:NAD(P)-dependent dehydrogenase (short-subunit alcohol dehydrogenase family)
MLRGKTVLITGSTRGIGRATALQCLAAGASVAINGRTASSVEAALADLAEEDRRDSFGGRIVAAPGDVSTVAGCEAAVAAAQAALGGIDVLVNCAGVAMHAAVEESDEELWTRTLDGNLKSAFFCTRAALPALRRARGAVVNLGSDCGLQGEKGLSVYCAAKGGVVNLTRALALEFAPEVRVNCICPGYVDTDMVRNDYLAKAADPEAALRGILRQTPLARMARPEEIADAIVFLASDKARFMTGTILQIDGGTTAGQAG